MCNCITEIDAHLKDKGAALNATLPLTGGPSRAIVSLIRTDKYILENRRGKPSVMLASFCPWCGEKYPEMEKIGELSRKAA